MRFGRSSNPALNKKILETYAGSVTEGNVMTVQGSITKTIVLVLLLVAAAAFTWRIFYNSGTMELGAQAMYPWMLAGGVGGFVLALVTIFVKRAAPFTAPLYAVLEGFLLGGLSAFLEAKFKGIVIQAVGLTFGVMFMLLLLYKLRIIKVTRKFRMGVMAATGAVMLVYVFTWIARLLGFDGIAFIHSGGILGIGISVVVIVIAALNLVLDFDFIEKGAEAGAPKFFEWYAGFGLLVTLVWLYLEILRLLAILSGRD